MNFLLDNREISDGLCVNLTVWMFTAALTVANSFNIFKKNFFEKIFFYKYYYLFFFYQFRQCKGQEAIFRKAFRSDRNQDPVWSEQKFVQHICLVFVRLTKTIVRLEFRQLFLPLRNLKKKIQI